MDNNEFLFRTTNTLVIARKSKIFVAIQKNTCVALDYFVTAFLVMTKPLRKQDFRRIGKVDVKGAETRFYMTG